MSGQYDSTRAQIHKLQEMAENKTDLIKYIPKPYKKRRFYNKSELLEHSTANDIWVSFFGDVYDLTTLVQSNIESKLVEPLIEAAGTDITHWFDNKTKQPRKMVDAQGHQDFYCPNGAYLHLDIAEDLTQIPWWKNQSFLIGKLTKQSQPIRIINTLSNTEDRLEVPQEQTLWEILDRYQEINVHARSYTWKRKQAPLNMDLTLRENGIVDHSAEYEEFEVPQQQRYVPAIHIHFNDDLTSK